LANVKLAGVNISGGVVPPEPVPFSDTTCGLNAVASVMLTEPLMAPAVVGEKVTARLHFPFGASEPVQVVPVELIA